ncbi:MAG: hypothetical protein EBZ77_10475 [Chitinophagia bacterium]|nr:hypothetical protein [Chitinophagia bacterium]
MTNKVGLMFLAGALVLSAGEVSAQKRSKKFNSDAEPVMQAAPAPASNPVFSTMPSGLQYYTVTHGTGNYHPKLGDHLEMHIHVSVNDSTMFDSRQMNQNKPVPFVVQPPSFKGDPIEGFMTMVAGDSTLFRLPVDSLVAQKKPLMPGMKAGDWLNYKVVLVSVQTDEDFKKEQNAKLEAQKSIDDAKMQAYFKEHNIKAMKTASGLYYTINKPGTGANAQNGMSVKVNYTGKLLGSSQPFDSNVDSNFRHVEPFNVMLGTGSVIKGWDEGLALLNKGAKATLYIPSGLAYGSQDRSPTIPANSVLVFDVEILDIQTKEQMEKDKLAADRALIGKDEKLIKEYIAKKKLKATKTASGLYYVITTPGTGPKAKAGQKVSVKYNGTFLDGQKFDGNMDRPEPFEFTLGQGAVIPGWDEGIALLNKGAKATLLLPSNIAYGARGAGPIPPNSVLLFDVVLVDIK